MYPFDYRFVLSVHFDRQNTGCGSLSPLSSVHLDLTLPVSSASVVVIRLRGSLTAPMVHFASYGYAIVPSLQADLPEIAVCTGFHIGDFEAGHAVGLFWLYHNLPVTGVHGPEIVFIIDIGHFDRIVALDGPYPPDGLGWKQSYVKRAGL
jgi:hypothetical protein